MKWISSRYDDRRSDYGFDSLAYAGLLLVVLLTGALVTAISNQSDNEATAPDMAVNSTPEPSFVLAAVTPRPTLAPSQTPSLAPTSPVVIAEVTASQTPGPSETPTITPTPSNTPTPFVPPPTFTPDPGAPLPTPESGVLTITVPILMYHYVSLPPADADRIRVGLSIDPARFRQQMEYLAINGYTTLDLYDLSLIVTGKQPLPPRPVILTFDDGYRDQYENAFPILRSLGLKATFFIITEFVDLGHPAYMDWHMIEEMSAAGMRIEPHTKTHPDLTVKDHARVVYEILGSMETVEAHIGYRPRFFAYPGGSYDEQAVEVLRSRDFWGAVTTRSGAEHGFHDRYTWKRLRVRNDTSIWEFIDLVTGKRP